MSSRNAIDLPVLDRDVRRAALRLEQLRALLAKGTPEARDKARSFDVWDGVRQTATQATYRALLDLEPSILDIPLRDGLARWVHELLQARIGQDLAIADADAVHTIDERLPASRVAAATQAVIAGEVDEELLTYGGALRAIVTAPNAARAAEALERAGELAAPIAAVRKERRERRFEAARRLGLAHPFALATKSDLALAANQVLDATEPLALSLLKDARKKSDGPWSAAAAIQHSLAREAGDGWPSHLTQRWLDESFKALAPRGVDPGPLPAPLGGASFLRAAVSWGFAWRTNGTARTMPFGLARDPYSASAHRFAFALGWVVAEPAFQRRVLELPSRLAIGQSRTLRVAMFHHVRMIAVRTLLTTSENVSASTFEELGVRVFGAPLPSALRNAWPAPHVNDASMLVGLLGTQAFVADLVRRYDEDWFRNPKAGAHLVSLACGPAFDDDPIADGAAAALAPAFEEALG